MNIGSIGSIKQYQQESAGLTKEWNGLLQVQLK